MREFKSFKEVLDAFKAEELPLAIIQALGDGQWDFYNNAGFGATYQIPTTTPEMWEEFADGRDTFDWQYGGNIFICETEEDLKQIEQYDLDWADEHEGKWPTILDKVFCWDVCDYVDQNKETKWAHVLQVTNDAGGPVYFIPESLWSICKLEEHIKMTKEGWDVNNTSKSI